MTLSGLAYRLGLIALVSGAASAARAADADPAQIEAMRKELSKYEDPYVAVRDLYLSTVGCVHYDGSKMEGHMDYPKGRHGHTLRQPDDPGPAGSAEAQCADL